MSLVLPSRQFCSFSRKNGISTEISNLRKQIGVGEFPRDFYIESERTGVKKLFLLEKVHQDNEGDVTHATYFHPGDARIPTVTLWND